MTPEMNSMTTNCARFLPILYSKVLDINVTRALSRHTSVDHVDGRLVVAVHDSRAFRRKAEVGHDCLNVSSMLCSGTSGKDLRFGGAGSSDRLCFALVGDGAATQKEGIASSGSAVAQIIGVCGIKECNGFLSVDGGKIR